MPRKSYKRGIAPAQRTTRELRASLHDRLAGTRGVQELAEIERRVADVLAANARGEITAADVVQSFYDTGWAE